MFMNNMNIYLIEIFFFLKKEIWFILLRTIIIYYLKIQVRKDAVLIHVPSVSKLNQKTPFFSSVSSLLGRINLTEKFCNILFISGFEADFLKLFLFLTRLIKQEQEQEQKKKMKENRISLGTLKDKANKKTISSPLSSWNMSVMKGSKERQQKRRREDEKGRRRRKEKHSGNEYAHGKMHSWKYINESANANKNDEEEKKKNEEKSVMIGEDNCKMEKHEQTKRQKDDDDNNGNGNDNDNGNGDSIVGNGNDNGDDGTTSMYWIEPMTSCATSKWIGCNNDGEDSCGSDEIRHNGDNPTISSSSSSSSSSSLSSSLPSSLSSSLGSADVDNPIHDHDTKHTHQSSKHQNDLYLDEALAQLASSQGSSIFESPVFFVCLFTQKKKQKKQTLVIVIIITFVFLCVCVCVCFEIKKKRKEIIEKR
ncbi:myb domain-containing protein [Reticulomyxa filosa]|uniref:Myb domain-containing protein n=1 Tax=Reticulomyxa filosa TaxID=46433 RepID=X6LYB6_RETFI|nr:myb domain-containing protein [Reticulomyxa filosa]|eukprot:ETO06346.1 myb domain-containing protein [Reticulomyxa filosa]